MPSPILRDYTGTYAYLFILFSGDHISPAIKWKLLLSTRRNCMITYLNVIVDSIWHLVCSRPTLCNQDCMRDANIVVLSGRYICSTSDYTTTFNESCDALDPQIIFRRSLTVFAVSLCFVCHLLIVFLGTSSTNRERTYWSHIDSVLFYAVMTMWQCFKVLIDSTARIPQTFAVASRKEMQMW